MRGNKKIRRNKFRREASDSVGFNFMESLEICLKFIMIIIVISLTTLLFIFIHDGLTQSQYFSLNRILVSGNSRITRSEVLKQAGVVKGENIFSINLFKVKKRLIANDWIADASIKRIIPSGLVITIKEEKPLAVVKIGKGSEILINTLGIPFTEYDKNTDQKEMNLPLIKGLALKKKNGIYGFSGRSFNSVMKFLLDSYAYVRGSGCPVNFRNKIREMVIDRDMGLTLKLDDFLGTAVSDSKMGSGSQILPGQKNSNTVINLKMGFGNYEARYRRIGRIINYLKINKINRKICSIDLSDLRNVAVKFQEDRNRDDFTGGIKGGV